MESGISNIAAWGTSVFATTEGVGVSCGSSSSFAGGYAIVEYVE
jgi:hypothetical protein